MRINIEEDDKMAEVKIGAEWNLSEITEILSKTIEYVGQDSLGAYELQYGTLDSYIKKLEKAKEALRADILQEFERRFGHQGHTYENNETGGSLQRVIQIRTNIDDDKVKKILSPKKWDMVKKEIADKEKLFDAIRLGVIKSSLVREAITDQEIEDRKSVV